MKLFKSNMLFQHSLIPQAESQAMDVNVRRSNATWKCPQKEGKGMVHEESYHSDSQIELLRKAGLGEIKLILRDMFCPNITGLNADNILKFLLSLFLVILLKLLKPA